MKILLVCLTAILLAGCLPTQKPYRYYRDEGIFELNNAIHFEANREYEKAGRAYEDAATSFTIGAEGNERPFHTASCYLKAAEMAEIAGSNDLALTRYEFAWKHGDGPGKAIALYRKGLLLKKLNRPDEARAAFQKVLAYMDTKPLWGPGEWLRTASQEELK